MKDSYFQSVIMIERLHRLFLEVVKVELDRMSTKDINNIQCLILYNIGQGEVTVGELTNRGYYLGSNVSYNLRKMVQNAYLIQEPSAHDRRSSHVRLSDKGLELYGRLDKLFQTHAEALTENNIGETKLQELGQALRNLESFWRTRLTQNHYP